MPAWVQTRNPVDQLLYVLEKQIHQMKAMVQIVNIIISYVSVACTTHVSVCWMKAIQYLQTEYNWKPMFLVSNVFLSSDIKIWWGINKENRVSELLIDENYPQDVMDSRTKASILSLFYQSLLNSIDDCRSSLSSKSGFIYNGFDRWRCAPINYVLNIRNQIVEFWFINWSIPDTVGYDSVSKPQFEMPRKI